MTDQRIKELMAQCGLPESRSLYSALKQLETEVRIEYGDTPWQAARATAEQRDPTPEPFGYVYRIISESRPHDPMYRFAKTGELNPDPEVVKSWTKHAVYLTSQLSRTRDSVLDLCAKAADTSMLNCGCAAKIRALKSQQDAAIESKQAEQSAFSGVDSAYQDWHRENYFGRIAAPKYVEIWRAACSWQAERQNSVIQSLRNALALMMDVGFQHLPANERARRYDIADAAIESQRSGDGS